MPFKKGMQKIGGRSKGVPNKDSLGLEERAHARGVDIFQVALDFVTGNYKALGYENECYFMEKPDGAVKMGYTITPEMRLKACEFLMKYVYPQKKALEIAGATEGIKIIIEDYSKK